jgi:general secretion pathway protein M
MTLRLRIVFVLLALTASASALAASLQIPAGHPRLWFGNAQRLQQAQRALATRPGFLRETSAELASAGLVQRLESAVATASPGNRSCAISNRSPLAQPGNERFAAVAVQVRLSCGTPELATVLYALESGTPRLFVENLNVLAQTYSFAPGTASAGLDVSFDLYGYLRPAAAPVPSAAAATALPAGAGNAN